MNKKRTSELSTNYLVGALVVMTGMTLAYRSKCIQLTKDNRQVIAHAEAAHEFIRDMISDEVDPEDAGEKFRTSLKFIEQVYED